MPASCNTPASNREDPREDMESRESFSEPRALPPIISVKNLPEQEQQVTPPWFGLDGLAQLIAAADACGYADERQSHGAELEDQDVKDGLDDKQGAGIDVRACSACAKRKVRCDRNGPPCAGCKSRNSYCAYPSLKGSSPPRSTNPSSESGSSSSSPVSTPFSAFPFDLQPPPFLFRRACVPCASRKKRCDRIGPPCSSCKHRNSHKCVYPGTTIADSFEALRGTKRPFEEPFENAEDGWSSAVEEEPRPVGKQSHEASFEEEEEEHEHPHWAPEDPEEEEYIPHGSSSRPGSSSSSSSSRKAAHVHARKKSRPAGATSPPARVPSPPVSTPAIMDAALARDRRACLACTQKKKGCDRMGPPCGTCRNSRNPEACTFPPMPVVRRNTPSPTPMDAVMQEGSQERPPTDTSVL